MSRESKNKKSTSKYRKFKVSPLIPVIAAIEVIILIIVGTYAWLTVVQNKNAETGFIAVDADSGLDIDFKNANYNERINIWDSVEPDFAFEPMTSIDGRNLYIPTSGTFNHNNNTSNIIFREATVNDINTKYLNIDFMMTNSSGQDMQVYLNNESYFYVKNQGSNEHQNSRALRLAFYNNDGKSGEVGSTLLANTNDENASLSDNSNAVTVYFNKDGTSVNGSEWGDVYAYVYDTSGSSGNAHEYLTAWPGSKMTHVAGKVYSYTFSNPYDSVQNKYTYDRIIFNNGTMDNSSYANGTQTNTLNFAVTTSGNDKIWHCYQYSNSTNSTGSDYVTRTVYFRKPDGWSKAYANVFNGNSSFTGFPGDEMTDCGAGIYSFTFPTNYGTVKFSDGTTNNESGSYTVPAVTSSTYPPLCQYTGKGATPSATKYTEKTVYFYNTYGWTTPYVYLKSSSYSAQIAMTTLSGNVYYATVPSLYDYIYFEQGRDQNNKNYRTTFYQAQDGYIYRPSSTQQTNSAHGLSIQGYVCESFNYSSYADNGTYAVISPGVSAGFQRSYSPVVEIYPNTDANAGKAKSIVPAFASSIDKYIYGSENPLFVIKPHEMKSLSMIIWLEGTDEACDASTYASVEAMKKQIELYLEFSTQTVNRGDLTTYTYRFYDKTKEVWTSDRLPVESGVTVSPVMQLYDATAERGYLMHPASTTNVNGVTKVDMWEVDAPTQVATAGHDIFFRRVNPYNEDEVWNYWHPGPLGSGGSISITDAVSPSPTNIKYVNFTAFADGAPASSTGDTPGTGKDADHSENATIRSRASSMGAPARSCGGLWGAHETELIQVLDGTSGFAFSNNGGSNSSAMTINFTYTYSNGGSHTIEYKASGSEGVLYNQMYYFVIPKKIYNTSSYTVKFKHYTNFNGGYAMNIPFRNAALNGVSGDTQQIAAKITGHYAYIQKLNSTNTGYWGSGIFYVRAANNTDDNHANLYDGSACLRLEFKNGNTIKKTAYLYSQNTSISVWGYYGYATVVATDSNKFNLVRGSNYTTTWNEMYAGGWTYDSSKRLLTAYKYTNDGSYDRIDGDYAACDSSWPK